MISHRTKAFKKLFKNLPSSIRLKAKEVYLLWKENPRHPGVRFKKVHQTEPIYSARIDRDYRAVGILHRETVIWFWIGKHEEYERLLKSL